jgi:hypothetical protein
MYSLDSDLIMQSYTQNIGCRSSSALAKKKAIFKLAFGTK